MTNLKQKLKPILIIIVVIVIVVGIYAVVSPVIKDTEYYIIHTFTLYDGILFNNEIYYIAEDKGDHLPTAEKVKVHLVRGDKVYYDRDEYANMTTDGTDSVYLYFNSAYYTKDRSLAIKPYRTPDK